MKRGYDRTQRIADLIQKALAQILLQDMSDDRLRLVTITSVTVSRDLSYAKVYVTVMADMLDDQDKIKEILTALNRLAKPIRYQLAKAVKLRVAPEIKFVYDESTAYGFKINTLLNEAIKKTENKG
jgi:ribosome-binding factor A